MSENENTFNILDIVMGSNDADAVTIKDYLIALLEELWRNGEDWVKRPFGNSGWQYEIYDALAEAGLIFADTYEDEGHIWTENHDVVRADDLILKAIKEL